MTKKFTAPLAVCLLLAGGQYLHAGTITPQPQPPLTVFKLQSDDTRLVCGALRDAQRNFGNTQRTDMFGTPLKPSMPDVLNATQRPLRNYDLVYTQQRIEYPVRMMIGTLTHVPSGQFITTQVPIPHDYHGAPQSWQYAFLWIYAYATLLGVPVDLEHYTEEHDGESGQAQQQT